MTFRFKQVDQSGVVVGTLFLIFSGAIYALSYNLPAFLGPRVGPGYMPRLLAAVMALFALGVLVGACRGPIVQLTRWSLRGPILVVASMVLFGLMVKPFGLVLASVTVVMMNWFAAPDRKLSEAAPMALCLTVFVSLLFPYLLGLPIPLFPHLW